MALALCICPQTMSENKVLRAWEERVISLEKGSRLVHYILKDNTGNSLLAVVGRERSINHMAYVISEDFLRVFGSMSTIHAGKKWEARREVVEFLTSVVSRGGPILANSNPQQSNNAQRSAEKIEGSAPEGPAMRASKGYKRQRVDRILKSSCPGLTDLISDDQAVKWEQTRKRLKFKLPSKKPTVITLSVPEPKCQVFPAFTENIELLSQDSGMQGCWFRCKILHSSQNRLKIQYTDVLEVDGARKLEEWVSASTVAAPDKLGVRCVGRLTVRPWPCEDSSDITLVVGAAVDAWWCNGWWEGVVIGYDAPRKTNLQVYFPGENRFLTVARKNIRVSRDWIDSEWVDIKAKHDILSFLSSIFSTGPKLPPLPVLAEANCSATNSQLPSPRKHEGSEDDKLKVRSSSVSANLKAVGGLNLKKQLLSKYNEEMSCRRSS